MRMIFKEMIENIILSKYSKDFLSDFLIYLKAQEDSKRIVYLKDLQKELGLENAQFASIIYECNEDKLIIQNVEKKGPRSGDAKIVLTSRGVLLADELLYFKYKPKLTRELLCFLRKKKINNKPVYLKDVIRQLWKDHRRNYENRRSQASKLINNLRDDHLIETAYFNYSSNDDSRKEIRLTTSGLLLADRISYDQLTDSEVKLLKLVNSFPLSTRKDIYRNLLSNSER